MISPLRIRAALPTGGPKVLTVKDVFGPPPTAAKLLKVAAARRLPNVMGKDEAMAVLNGRIDAVSAMKLNDVLPDYREVVSAHRLPMLGQLRELAAKVDRGMPLTTHTAMVEILKVGVLLSGKKKSQSYFGFRSPSGMASYLSMPDDFRKGTNGTWATSLRKWLAPAGIRTVFTNKKLSEADLYALCRANTAAIGIADERFEAFTPAALPSHDFGHAKAGIRNVASDGGSEAPRTRSGWSPLLLENNARYERFEREAVGALNSGVLQSVSAVKGFAFALIHERQTSTEWEIMAPHFIGRGIQRDRGGTPVPGEIRKTYNELVSLTRKAFGPQFSLPDCPPDTVFQKY